MCVSGSTYRDLEDELLATIVCLEGIENRRKLVGIEFYYIETLESRSRHVSSFVSIFDAIRSSMREEFSKSLTIYDGTDDLMDLAMEGAITRKSGRCSS
jgi:hypothetical protein